MLIFKIIIHYFFCSFTFIIKKDGSKSEVYGIYLFILLIKLRIFISQLILFLLIFSSLFTAIVNNKNNRIN